MSTAHKNHEVLVPPFPPGQVAYAVFSNGDAPACLLSDYFASRAAAEAFLQSIDGQGRIWRWEGEA